MDNYTENAPDINNSIMLEIENHTFQFVSSSAAKELDTFIIYLIDTGHAIFHLSNKRTEDNKVDYEVINTYHDGDINPFESEFFCRNMKKCLHKSMSRIFQVKYLQCNATRPH